jgi:hypothetical protein
VAIERPQVQIPVLQKQFLKKRRKHEIENFISLMKSKEVELVIKNFSIQDILGPNDFTGKFYHT